MDGPGNTLNAIILMRDDGDLGQGSNSGVDKKKLNSRYILTVDLTGFSEEQDVKVGGGEGLVWVVIIVNKRVQRQFQGFWPEQLEGWNCY